jgi:DNA replication and repair protein RecF
VRIDSLYVRSLRNIKEASLLFHPKINVFLGDNAQGKTSLLEAIWIIMTGSSFRTTLLSEAVRSGGEGFFLEGSFSGNDLSFHVELSFLENKKHLVVNRRHYDSHSHLVGELLGVMIPSDIGLLVKGHPPRRRHFLNLVLCQIDPLYVHHLNRYMKAVRARNVLLRKKQFATLSAWEKELSQSASYITKKRLELTSEIEPLVFHYFSHLRGNCFEMKLSYETKAPQDIDEDALVLYFKNEYEKRRSSEALYGITLVGPHRDDLKFSFNDKGMRESSSEGEARLLGISMKLAEWSVIENKTGVKPLLLIDDFHAFLDRGRASSLFEIISTFGQVCLSCHELPKELSSQEGTHFIVEEGKIYSPSATLP